MAYVGEILFAKAGRRREGLAWTQDAISLAETAGMDSKVGGRERKMCEQCIGTGLGNWKSMTAQLSRESLDARKGATEANAEQSLGWLSWLNGRAAVKRGPDRAFLEEQDWTAEEKRAQKRLTEFEEKRLNKTLSAMISGTSSWFVV